MITSVFYGAAAYCDNFTWDAYHPSPTSNYRGLRARSGFKPEQAPCVPLVIIAAEQRSELSSGLRPTPALDDMVMFGMIAQVGTMTHQPPELLRDGRMSPAVDIYR